MLNLNYIKYTVISWIYIDEIQKNIAACISDYRFYVS